MRDSFRELDVKSVLNTIFALIFATPLLSQTLTPEVERLLAQRFAPVIIQDVSGFRDKTGRSYSNENLPKWRLFAKDIPTSAVITDPEENRCTDRLDVTCNRLKIKRLVDNAAKHRDLSLLPLPALYYYVVESESHYFITYASYHAEDWKTQGGHDHDMEMIQIVVSKDPNGNPSEVVALAVNAHFSVYRHFNNDDLILKRFFLWKWMFSLGQNSDGKIVTIDRHPVIFGETKGHGLYSLHRNWRWLAYKPKGDRHRKEVLQTAFDKTLIRSCDVRLSSGCTMDLTRELSKLTFDFMILFPSITEKGEYGPQVTQVIHDLPDKICFHDYASYGLISTLYSDDFGYFKVPQTIRERNYLGTFNWKVNSNRPVSLSSELACRVENIPQKLFSRDGNSEGRTEFRFEFSPVWKKNLPGDLVLDPASAWTQMFRWKSLEVNAAMSNFLNYKSNEYLRRFKLNPPNTLTNQPCE